MRLLFSSLLISCSFLGNASLHSFLQEGQRKDTLEIPGVVKVKKGGRGDGTGGGRGDRSGQNKKLPEKLIDADESRVPEVEGSHPVYQDTTEANRMLEIAKTYFNLDLDTAIILAKKSLLLSEKIEFTKGAVRARGSLSIFYVESARSKEGLANGAALLELVSDQPDYDRSGLYGSMAYFYQMENSIEESRKYWYLALNSYMEHKDTIKAIVSSIDVGFFHETIQEYDKAIKVLEEGLQFSILIDNHVAVHYITGSIGNMYSYKGDFEKAIESLNQSLSLKKLHYRPVSLAYGYYHLQQAYLRAGYPEESIKYGEQVQQTLNINPGTYLFKNSLAASNQAHTALGDEIPPLLDQSDRPILNSLNNYERLMQVRQLKAIYNNEKTDEYIYLQRDEIDELETEKAFQKKLAIFIGVGIALLFAAVFLVRSRAFAIREKKIQEAFSQQLLGYQESERKRISRDLHDSIGQSLILIKNKVQLENDSSTSEMVAQTLEEVRSISKQLHPVLLEKLGLTASIEKMVSEIDDSSELFLESELDMIDTIFPKEMELHIYRIIQESLNNVIKHSGTPSAAVKVENLSGSIKCSVIDHGKGFDLTEDTEVFKSLGMLTLKERTKILKGHLSIDSTKGKGTSIVLTIEKPKA